MAIDSGEARPNRSCGGKLSGKVFDLLLSQVLVFRLSLAYCRGSRIGCVSLLHRGRDHLMRALLKLLPRGCPSLRKRQCGINTGRNDQFQVKRSIAQFPSDARRFGVGIAARLPRGLLPVAIRSRRDRIRRVSNETGNRKPSGGKRRAKYSGGWKPVIRRATKPRRKNWQAPRRTSRARLISANTQLGPAARTKHLQILSINDRCLALDPPTKRRPSRSRRCAV